MCTLISRQVLSKGCETVLI
uniref:Uncharacterized protein n=1 Tax=Rhizophora mucronata TaxID=61149 RepID=A0A2P2R305_RHIMU